ncbi:4-hydroxy-tetrahydrodipicolinate reductase [Candidatus Aerophobetes bacterium]|uniref:4-hydroxy-tetrahydrodipicolinate reductase n=1 Tax=Aerophobetes bacterium TaxID=2030807 RepID=A0A497E348_UNCAE|nr:MAG: 4-hydroxy-tetrahydrodipicolinate reductase [Candidatus Aerophobetes bacterium]
MIKVIVCGACGRMGREVILKVDQAKEMSLIGAVEAPDHPSIGKIIKGVRVTSDLERIAQVGAVVIEFTTPQATIEHLEVAKRKKMSMVIGTTGFNEDEYNKIREASHIIPILISPNMSIGINVLFRVVEEVSRALGKEFDKEIIEAHHRNKKDAPSGTAKKIAEIIAKAAGENLSQVGVYGRKGLTGKRSEKEIGIHAVRGGSIVGDHTVLFAGEGERLEIIHRAESRQIFAQGAIMAAKFISKQQKGLFDLQDALGLRRSNEG